MSTNKIENTKKNCKKKQIAKRKNSKKQNINLENDGSCIPLFLTLLLLYFFIVNR